MELDQTLTLIDEPGVDAVLSPTRLEPRTLLAHDLHLIADGIFSKQWSNWYDDIVEDPDKERRVRRYWLYAHQSEDG